MPTASPVPPQSGAEPSPANQGQTACQQDQAGHPDGATGASLAAAATAGAGALRLRRSLPWHGFLSGL
jgi:hypothetical protein